jgi:hypothetical protein
VNVHELEARHEEADTHIVLHCVKRQALIIVVAARDTDVLVLLLSHLDTMSCSRLWMKGGTSRNRKYIPIHTIAAQPPFDNLNTLEALPAFHAITDCDTTSYLAGNSKKSCWQVYTDNSELLTALGRQDLYDDVYANAEVCICKVLKVSATASVNEARSQLFVQARPLEALPLTQDALILLHQTGSLPGIRVVSSRRPAPNSAPS